MFTHLFFSCVFSCILAFGLHFLAYFFVNDATDEYQLFSPRAYFLLLCVTLLLIPWIYFYGITMLLPLLFLSALLVTFYTDAQTRLISRFVTLFLVPFVWIAGYFNYLPLSFEQSLIGSFLGFFILWTVSQVAFYITKQEGMGQGDIDLLCFIGSFLGPIGMWYTLMIGALLGSSFGIACVCVHGKKARSIPLAFGSFLAIGACLILFIMYDIIFL
ncbi:A24 family peptidase [Candidatus Babeliales bacterium]|nr:A24 family peptidase [Candidatus Babeliales bacterium]